MSGLGAASGGGAGEGRDDEGLGGEGRDDEGSEGKGGGPAAGEGGAAVGAGEVGALEVLAVPAGLCPPLLAGQIVYEDGDLLVLEKPAGVAAGGAEGDDLVARARAFLEARPGGFEGPLLAPWREGAERAALVPLARSEAMRRALGAARGAWQAQGGASRLAGRPAGPAALTGPSPRGGGGQGAPRGEAFPGLVVAPHPRSGEPLRLRAPVARGGAAWAPGGQRRADAAGKVGGGAVEEWRRRLERAALLRYGLDRGGETTAFRLANEAADGLPRGATVDLYGPYAVAHLYDAAGNAPYLDALLDALLALGARGAYVKHHPRGASTLADPARDDVAPSRPARGETAPDALWVREGGLALLCRLGAGLATGLYLDQRDNRARVRAAAAGRSVLNLFAYTGAFSVAAAAGGARRTVTVDVSRPALAWAAENLAANGFGDERTHRLVREDALVFLRRAAVRGDRYDLIVLDPPSFATTKASRFVAEQDLGALVASALAVAAPGALVLACTNHRGTSRARFRHALDEAARETGRRLERVRQLEPPRDFASPPGEEPPFKALWALVGA